MRFWPILGILLVCGCSDVSGEVSEPAAPIKTVRIVETVAGSYKVELTSSVDALALPDNSDIKMLDGDLARYSVKLCGLDFPNVSPPQRCEIFVQPDEGGLITGYVALRQSNVVNIETAFETDVQRTGLGCFLSGEIQNANGEGGSAEIDIAGNFKGRLPFFGWEKSPGNWMISSDGSDTNSAGGMWYLERLNNNLRISQERWNYCYRDDSIEIDEVFVHAATVTRATR